MFTATCLTSSRLERYFALKVGFPAPVLLVNPAEDRSVPPLDLLKLSTFLKKRGYSVRLQNRVGEASSPEPIAAVFTSVFSWDIPNLRRAIEQVHSRWPATPRVLMGVLPRKFGDSIQKEFGVGVLDEHSEALLDDESPDYSFVPDWDASVLITSKGICP
jgi:hypothetical protein